MRRTALGIAICLIAIGCSAADDDSPGAATTAVAPEADTSPEQTADTAETETTETETSPSPSTVSRASAPAAVPPTSASPTVTAATQDPTTFGELGETDAVITGDRGTLQIGEVDLPAALDTDFPLPDDLTVVLASEVDDSLGFTGSTALAFDAAVELYRDGLPAAGYAVEAGQYIDGVVAVFAFDGPDGSGDVALSASPRGGTDVIVAFES